MTTLTRREQFAIKVIKEYADENIRMAQDTILLDPVLHPERHKPMTIDERFNLAEKFCIDGAIHSAKFHAACEILALLGIRNDRYDPTDALIKELDKSEGGE